MRNPMEITSLVENPNPTWLLDYDLLIMEDIDFPATISAANFSPPPPLDFTWVSQPIINCSSIARLKSESYASGSKSCRERLRTERFLELGSLLEERRPHKVDKSAILSDAVRVVAQLQSETERLKESNEDLKEKIKELKVESNELRDEKQKLKTDKEQLELRIKALSAQPGYHLSAMGVAFAAQRQASGNKLMPFINYPGDPMWQFMQPAVVDTSQDHVLHPPVA